MSIEVFCALRARDSQLIGEKGLGGGILGFATAILTSFEGRAENALAPEWSVVVLLGQGSAAREIRLDVPQFIGVDQYGESHKQPLCLADIRGATSNASATDRSRVWLFRDAFYVADRVPQPSEIEEVILRVKALHYQHEDSLRKLREQVSNYEATEGQVDGTVPIRRRIRDDVRLLVWARDKGSCVKCASTMELQFDHIIPLARGGSDEAANIQLLCRTCNLAKGDRLI